ncbi:hypothetical protein GQ457_03G026690 [Hibiscus cannabinus]
MATIIETYEANTKMMKQNNKILQEILKQVKLVSKKLGIVDEVEISDAREVGAKQDDPEMKIHRVFDELPTTINTKINKQPISSNRELDFQKNETMLIASSSVRGTTKNPIEVNTCPKLDDEMFERWNEDGSLDMKAKRQPPSIEKPKATITNFVKMSSSLALSKPFVELIYKEDASLVMMRKDSFQFIHDVVAVGCKLGSIKVVYNENTTKPFFLRSVDVENFGRDSSPLFTNGHELVKDDDTYGF